MSPDRTEIRRIFREIKEECDEWERTRPRCPLEGHIGPRGKRFNSGNPYTYCRNCGERWPENSVLDQLEG